MSFLFKEINSLPHPPDILVNSLLNNWIKKYKTFYIKSSFPNLELELDDISKRLPIVKASTIDPIQDDILFWLKENVCSSDRDYSRWIFRMLYYFSIKENLNDKRVIYEKHLDSVLDKNVEQSNYALIYNLTNSVGDLVFYKEENKPLIREDRPVYIGKNLNKNLKQLPHERQEFLNCEEVLRVSPIPMSWYLIRIDVIHSLENGNSVPRAALQLRLSQREVDKIFN